MKNQLLELIAIRVMESGNTSGSMEQFEIDGLFYDCDYTATIETQEGMKSSDYDVQNDDDLFSVTITEIEIRNIWNKFDEMVELGNINNQFYIL